MDYNDEHFRMFISIGTESQHRTILDKLNHFYENLTGIKNFDIENFQHFVIAFTKSNTIPLCNILIHFATNCFYLYDSHSQIIKHRNYYNNVIKFMIANTRPMYPNIQTLCVFTNQNNSYRYAYHDISNVELFQNIAYLQAKLCPDLIFHNKYNKTNHSNKIKIAFISDLVIKLHSVAKDRLGIIKHLIYDPHFDVKIITRHEPDLFFQKIMFDSDTHSHPNFNLNNIIIKMDPYDLLSNRKQIADEHFDIIVYPEIGMCSRSRFIAFSRLAPIQINTWGHSDTSGLPNIDYFISSKYFNSKNDHTHYSEKLVLFDSIGTYYYNIFNLFNNEFSFQDDENILRNNIIQQTHIDNPNIYGCIQVFIKFNPAFVQILNDILKADDNAIIVLLSTNKGDNDDILFTNYIKSNIYLFERIYFIHQSPFHEFAKIIKSCDLILDYYPFGGFNSTIESFLLGKICITLPGNRISSKFTQGLYQKMDIYEFICHSNKEYVSKAVEYANNPQKRKQFEEIILANTHKIIEDKDSVHEWKTFLKKIYYEKIHPFNNAIDSHSHSNLTHICEKAG